ncbi:hypothetical protein Hypma_014119 [Hypsizygus marmoreus]|uniref:DUF6604 domain-containing protein n=1 Tax=Hypsizygus marmoreus TaxID=39966 RepID=A0A369KBE9_HYPMA|nr:hypothetical protein Hypma_014119 [Hypsizygus marmoreus]
MLQLDRRVLWEELPDELPELDEVLSLLTPVNAKRPVPLKQKLVLHTSIENPATTIVSPRIVPPGDTVHTGSIPWTELPDELPDVEEFLSPTKEKVSKTPSLPLLDTTIPQPVLRAPSISAEASPALINPPIIDPGSPVDAASHSPALAVIEPVDDDSQSGNGVQVDIVVEKGALDEDAARRSAVDDVEIDGTSSLSKAVDTISQAIASEGDQPTEVEEVQSKTIIFQATGPEGDMPDQLPEVEQVLSESVAPASSLSDESPEVEQLLSEPVDTVPQTTGLEDDLPDEIPELEEVLGKLFDAIPQAKGLGGSSIFHLSGAIYNTHRQYKHSCQLMARWVHHTASQIRLAKAESAPQSSTGNEKKSKPKAQASSRTKGRQNNNQKVDDDLSSPSIALTPFLSLVREIAASNIPIPPLHLALFSLTIRLRKTVTAFFSSDAVTWQQNESHRWAIEGHEDALCILEGAYQENVRSAGDNVAWDKREFTLAMRTQDAFGLAMTMQRLAVLVEEKDASIGASASASTADDDGANEWLQDLPKRRSAKDKDKDKRKAKVWPLEAFDLVDDLKTTKVQKVEEEASFALECFVLDIHRIRKYCNSIWATVMPGIGNMSRITASFVTNHAVNMVKQLERDFLGDFPQFKNVGPAQVRLLARISQNYPSLGPDRVYSVKEQLMCDTWDTLVSFSDMLNQGVKFPHMKDGHFGHFDPSADRQAMSLADKIREDKCILWTYWPDLVVMYNFNEGIPSSGKFIGDYGLPKEFRQLVKNEARPKSWTLLFCCQTMLDTVHVRRRYLDVDLAAMRSMGERCCGEMDKFTRDGVTYDPRMDDTKHLLKEVRSGIHHWLGMDYNTIVKVLHGFEKLSTQACQVDSLWRLNPWLTANAMSEAFMNFFLVGTDIVSDGGFVRSTMHLWNMLKQMGYLPPPSTDDSESDPTAVFKPGGDRNRKGHHLLMEHLVQVFGDEVFGGPPPAEKFFACFQTMFNPRPEAPSRGKRKPIQSPHFNAAGRGVSSIISDAWSLHCDDYALKQAETKSENAGSAGALNPLEYIRKLVESELGHGPLGDDTVKGPLVNLNFLKIHHLCVRLFTELDEVLREDFKDVFSRPYKEVIPTQVQWPMITEWIARYAESIISIDEDMLRKAGEVVQRVVGTKQVGSFIMLEE